MRVSFVVPSGRRPVGGVLALYEFANGLARRGHDVHLVHSPGVPDPVDALTDVEWFEFDPRIEHSVFTSFDDIVLPPADAVEVTALAFFADATTFEALLADGARDRGRPFVFVQAYRHLPEASEHRAFFGPWPKICIARWMVDALAALGVPDDQLAYIPYGLDHSVFRLTRAVANREPRIAMLHHPHPNKGTRFGLEAIAGVLSRRGDAHAVLFGTSDPPDTLPPRTMFVRSPPREVLVDGIYNASSVFLLPSVREGFGFCGIEAMAGGCALVSTANGGSSDYALDGDTALVVEPKDVAAMSDAVERLLGDDALRMRIATRGIELVERYDWDESARLLDAFLDQYVGQDRVD